MTASWTQWDSYQICTLVYKSCTWSEATLLQKRMQHISHSSIEAVSSTVNFQHNITNGTCKKNMASIRIRWFDLFFFSFFSDKRDRLVRVMSHQRVIAQSVFENSSHDCFISIWQTNFILKCFVEVKAWLTSHFWRILPHFICLVNLVPDYILDGSARKKIDLFLNS